MRKYCFNHLLNLNFNLIRQSEFQENYNNLFFTLTHINSRFSISFHWSFALWWTWCVKIDHLYAIVVSHFMRHWCHTNNLYSYGITHFENASLFLIFRIIQSPKNVRDQFCIGRTSMSSHEYFMEAEPAWKINTSTLKSLYIYLCRRLGVKNWRPPSLSELTPY